MEWIFDLARDYGLFVALVVYVLWDGRNREARYITIIDKLSDSFQALKNDVEAIKKKMWRDS